MGNPLDERRSGSADARDNEDYLRPDFDAGRLWSLPRRIALLSPP